MNVIDTDTERDSTHLLSKSNMIEIDTMNYISSKALKMMSNMGYKEGTSLGKQNDGLLDPIKISGNLGKRGLGLKVPGLEISNETWDFNLETITIEQDVKWLLNSLNNSSCSYSLDELLQWIVRGTPKLSIDDEHTFCDPVLLQKILKAKDIFNELDVVELSKARCRANPFESIRSAFFMNRAALKMANIDAVTKFIFTDIDRNPHHSKSSGPYYFADVCAGPGGFTEYILWRKKWVFKGFGFTLKAEHDFEINESQCVSPVTFSAHYGAEGDGDICNPDNIKHFTERVLHESQIGVHFMMADGGFSVEGNENLQEILSKQLYLSQCLTALNIVRTNGHFVTKLFDLFTEFSVGLVYLMYKCFEKIAIFKPNTSRPANAERYLICYGKKESSHTLAITQYLSRISEELWNLRQIENSTTTDINEIVPLSVITADKEFLKYITESNNSIGTRQVLGLQKLAVFCRNPTLIEPRQEDLRKKSLQYWRIPDKPKVPMPRFTIDALLNVSMRDPNFMLAAPKYPRDITNLSRLLKDTRDWYYTTLNSGKQRNTCNFYAGVSGSRVFRLVNTRWVRVKRLRLVCGTLLYGEMVKEHQISHDNEILKKSLHVIDALRLGDISLNDMSFDERYVLITTYCQAVNHESQTNFIRIRPKYFNPLHDTSMLKIFNNTEAEDSWCSLEPLGFKSLDEYYDTNSVLLLKVHGDHRFTTIFYKRIYIYFDKNDKTENNGTFFNRKITPDSLIELLKSDN